VPIGGVETLKVSGWAFASATRSAMVLTPSCGLTAKMLGVVAISAMATKSLNGS
jgi:hypothetical protein